MQGALALQPGCDQGPMAAYERTTLQAMLEARKAQTPLGPLPRDDVGVVVRDAGPGTWRGLMVGVGACGHGGVGACMYVVGGRHACARVLCEGSGFMTRRRWRTHAPLSPCRAP